MKKTTASIILANLGNEIASRKSQIEDRLRGTEGESNKKLVNEIINLLGDARVINKAITRSIKQDARTGIYHPELDLTPEEEKVFRKYQ